jgi:hypothetical protein
VKGHRPLNASSLILKLFFEQKDTLTGLPFLIWEFSGGRIQKMMVIGERRRFLVQ